MNIMGMGIPEVGVILLVAFLVLGPSRSIDMARSAGKMLGDLRRSFNEVTSAVSIEVTEQHSNGQDRSEVSPVEPPPGVPIRAEIPLEEEEEEMGPGSDEKAGSEDQG